MAKSKRRSSRKPKTQVIYSEPRKLFVETYLPPSAEKKVINKELSRKEAFKKYGKNRYRVNPNAKPIKVITHN